MNLTKAIPPMPVRFSRNMMHFSQMTRASVLMDSMEHWIRFFVSWNKPQREINTSKNMLKRGHRARKISNKKLWTMKNLENFLFSFSKPFLFSQFFDCECDMSNSLFKTIISFLFELGCRFLCLIDDPWSFTDNSVSEFLLIARHPRL